MFRSIWKSTLWMLAAAAIWYFIGLGYNIATNRVATVCLWIPPDKYSWFIGSDTLENYKKTIEATGQTGLSPEVAIRAWSSDELNKYSKTRDISILIGLAVGLILSVVSIKEPTNK